MSNEGQSKANAKNEIGEPQERTVEEAYAVTLVRPADNQPLLQKDFDRLVQDPFLSAGTTYLQLGIQDLDDGSKRSVIGPADMKEEEIHRFYSDAAEFFSGESFDYLRSVPIEYVKETRLN